MYTRCALVLFALLGLATMHVDGHMMLIFPPPRTYLRTSNRQVGATGVGDESISSGGVPFSNEARRCGTKGENVRGEIRVGTNVDSATCTGNCKDYYHPNWNGVLYTGIPFKMKVNFAVNHNADTKFALRKYADATKGATFSDFVLPGTVTSSAVKKYAHCGAIGDANAQSLCNYPGCTEPGCDFPDFPGLTMTIPPGEECEECAFVAWHYGTGGTNWNSCSDLKVQEPSIKVTLHESAAACTPVDCNSRLYQSVNTEGGSVFSFSGVQYLQTLFPSDYDTTYVKKVRYFVDGQVIGTSSTSPYSVQFDTTDYPNGARATLNPDDLIPLSSIMMVTATVTFTSTTTPFATFGYFHIENTYTCAAYTCGAGKVTLAANTCTTKQCSTTECCADPGVCSSLECLGDSQARAPTTVCASLVCQPDECCQGVCTGITCGVGLSKRINAETILCTKNLCIQAECCVDNTVCAAVACPGALLSREPTYACTVAGESSACSQSDCCYARGTCLQYQDCPGGQTNNNVDCLDDQASCNAATCCRATCLAYTCVGENPFKIANAPLCSGDLCSEGECCGTRTRCTGGATPEYECQSPSLPVVPEDAAGQMCATNSCTQDECCVQPQRNCKSNWVCPVKDYKDLEGSVICPSTGCSKESCCEYVKSARPDDLPLGATRFSITVSICYDSPERTTLGETIVAIFDEVLATQNRFAFVGAAEGADMTVASSGPDEAAPTCKKTVLTFDVLRSASPPTVAMLMAALVAQLADASSPLREHPLIKDFWAPTLPNSPNPSFGEQFVGGPGDVVPVDEPEPTDPDNSGDGKDGTDKEDKDTEKDADLAAQKGDLGEDASSPVVNLMIGVGVLLIGALGAGVLYFFRMRARYSKMESRFENEVRTKYDRRDSKKSVTVTM